MSKCPKCRGSLYQGRNNTFWHTNVPGESIGGEADDTICLMTGFPRKERDTARAEIKRLEGLLNHAEKIARKRNIEVLEILGETTPTNPEEHYIPPTTLARRAQKAEAEIERLQAIVNKLPEWADGLVEAHNQLHGIPYTRMGAKSIACVEQKIRKATAEAAEAGGK